MSGDSHAWIVTDLGFGDSGKGSITDYLARRYDAATVVRFNGGPQASHNVVTADGRHHAFHQFGSASFVPGSRTHLSRFMLVSPLLLWREAEELEAKGVADSISRITIDERALVISPYHEAANRIREILRKEDRHGSCGLGIGETMADTFVCKGGPLNAGDLASPSRALRILEQIREHKREEFARVLPSLRKCPEAARDMETLYDTRLSEDVVAFYRQFCSKIKIVSGDYLDGLLKRDRVVFEGAQGVLLDEWYGFHPYTTWSTTTNANADQLLQEHGFGGNVTRLGLLRTYATRHGPGPFVTEDDALSRSLADSHNPPNPWQQHFRVGHFDEVTARYALSVAGNIDYLVISHLDQVIGQPRWSTCSAYIKADGAHMAFLPRSETPDLGFQSHLTSLLLGCKPFLEPFREKQIDHKDMEGYVQKVETALGVKVSLTSTGPTANDKQPR